jgi:hypothetical protein
VQVRLQGAGARHGLAEYLLHSHVHVIAPLVGGHQVQGGVVQVTPQVGPLLAVGAAAAGAGMSTPRALMRAATCCVGGWRGHQLLVQW